MNPTNDEMDFGGWEGISTSTKFSEGDPFLGVIVVDELQPAKSEFAKGSHEWHFYVRPVNFKLNDETNAFRDIVQVSSKENSKLGAIMAGLKTVFGANVHIAAQQTRRAYGATESELVGRVAWFLRKELKFGNDIRVTATVAVRKATAEEVESAKDVGAYVAPEEAQVAAEAPFEWTEEAIKSALQVLDGQTERSKLRASRSLQGNEYYALRNAINSGEAERYLQENGYLTTDDAGVYHQVAQD